MTYASASITGELKYRVIRVNPYWKKPWIVRQILHVLGIAPYQDRKAPYHRRVIVVPVVRAMHIVKVLIREIKEHYHGRFK